MKDSMKEHIYAILLGAILSITLGAFIFAEPVIHEPQNASMTINIPIEEPKQVGVKKEEKQPFNFTIQTKLPDRADWGGQNICVQDWHYINEDNTINHTVRMGICKI